VNTKGEPAMMAASAGVVLPPKLKSALPPVTACRVGAWFGKGPKPFDLDAVPGQLLLELARAPWRSD